MTVREYNTKFYPKYSKAISFISCLDHTLINKCDDETTRQLKIIGWDEDTKKLIQDALNLLNESTRKETRFYEEVDEETSQKIEDIRIHCTELCSGGVQCLTCNIPKNNNNRMEFIECLD